MKKLNFRKVKNVALTLGLALAVGANGMGQVEASTLYANNDTDPTFSDNLRNHTRYNQATGGMVEIRRQNQGTLPNGKRYIDWVYVFNRGKSASWEAGAKLKGTIPANTTVVGNVTISEEERGQSERQLWSGSLEDFYRNGPKGGLSNVRGFEPGTVGFNDMMLDNRSNNRDRYFEPSSIDDESSVWRTLKKKEIGGFFEITTGVDNRTFYVKFRTEFDDYRDPRSITAMALFHMHNDKYPMAFATGNVDRDKDGYPDYVERDAGSSITDPNRIPISAELKPGVDAHTYVRGAANGATNGIPSTLIYNGDVDPGSYVRNGRTHQLFEDHDNVRGYRWATESDLNSRDRENGFTTGAPTTNLDKALFRDTESITYKKYVVVQFSDRYTQKVPVTYTVRRNPNDDYQAPTVNLTRDKVFLFNNTPFTSLKLADITDNVGVTSVDLLDIHDAVQTDLGISVDSNGMLSGQTNNTLGEYTRKIRATDAEGNQGTSGEFRLYNLDATTTPITGRSPLNPVTANDIKAAVTVNNGGGNVRENRDYITSVKIVETNNTNQERTNFPSFGRDNIVKVKLTTPSGTEKIVDVRVSYTDQNAAYTPTTSPQTVNLNATQVPAPADFITNKHGSNQPNALPQGTQFAWKNGDAPTIQRDSTTPQRKTVVVTYPDTSTDEIPVDLNYRDNIAPVVNVKGNTSTTTVSNLVVFTNKDINITDFFTVSDNIAVTEAKITHDDHNYNPSTDPNLSINKDTNALTGRINREAGLAWTKRFYARDHENNRHHVRVRIQTISAGATPIENRPLNNPVTVQDIKNQVAVNAGTLDSNPKNNPAFISSIKVVNEQGREITDQDLPKSGQNNEVRVELVTASGDRHTVIVPVSYQRQEDTFEPTTSPQTVNLSDTRVPSPESFITNKHGSNQPNALPQGTQFAWKNGDAPTIDRNSTTRQRKTVVVTYPDTSTDEILVDLNYRDNIAPIVTTTSSDLVVFANQPVNIVNFFDISDNIAVREARFADNDQFNTPSSDPTLTLNKDTRTISGQINRDAGLRWTKRIFAQDAEGNSHHQVISIKTVFASASAIQNRPLNSPVTVQDIKNQVSVQAGTLSANPKDDRALIKSITVVNEQGTEITDRDLPKSGQNNNVRVKVITASGHETIVTVPVSYTKQKAAFEPQAQEQTIGLTGQVPSAESFITNKHGSNQPNALPQGTQFAWKNGDAPTIDRNSTAQQRKTVVVTYPDTSTDEIEVALNYTDDIAPEVNVTTPKIIVFNNTDISSATPISLGTASDNIAVTNFDIVGDNGARVPNFNVSINPQGQVSGNVGNLALGNHTRFLKATDAAGQSNNHRASNVVFLVIDTTVGSITDRDPAQPVNLDEIKRLVTVRAGRESTAGIIRSTVPVADDGNTPLTNDTLPKSGNNVVKVKVTTATGVEKIVDVTVNYRPLKPVETPAEKVKVANANQLTNEEKQAVREKIKEANRTLDLQDDEIVVENNGNTTVTKPGVQPTKISASALVEQDNIAPVVDLSALERVAVRNLQKPGIRVTNGETFERTFKASDDSGKLVEFKLVFSSDETSMLENAIFVQNASSFNTPHLNQAGAATANNKLVGTLTAKLAQLVKPLNYGREYALSAYAVARDEAGNLSVASDGRDLNSPTFFRFIVELNKETFEPISLKPNENTDERLLVGDISSLSEDERGKILLALMNKNANLINTRLPGQNVSIEVAQNGTATVTYPDGSTDTIAVDKLAKQTPDKDKYNPTVAAGSVPAVTGQNPDEQAIKDKVFTTPDKDKYNPTVAAGSVPAVTGQNPDEQAIKDKVQLDQDKGRITNVQMPDNATDGERNAVVTIEYDDGTTETVNVPVLFTTPPTPSINKPDAGDRIPVTDPNNLTEDEINKVKEKLKDLNPGLKDEEIHVDPNGAVTITKEGVGEPIDLNPAEVIVPKVPDTNGGDGTDTGNGDGTGTDNGNTDGDNQPNPGTGDGNTDGGDNNTDNNGGTTGETDNRTMAEIHTINPLNPRVEVAKGNALTAEEKDKVIFAIKTANTGKPIAKVLVDPNGKATILYEDGSKDTLMGTETVVEKAAENPGAGNENPSEDTGTGTIANNTALVAPTPKVLVSDPNALTSTEMEEVKAAITRANPDKGIAHIFVDANGNATVIYTDGSRDRLSGSETVEKKPTDTNNGGEQPTPGTGDGNGTGGDNGDGTGTGTEPGTGGDNGDGTGTGTGDGNGTGGDNGDSTGTGTGGDNGDGTGTGTEPGTGGDNGGTTTTPTTPTVTEADRNNPVGPNKPVEVVNPKQLTEEEKDKVKDAVANANPDIDKDKIFVDPEGNVTIVYGDGSSDDISSAETIVKKPADNTAGGDTGNNGGTPTIPTVTEADRTDIVAPTTKVEVENPEKLTPEEIEKVKEAVVAANTDKGITKDKITVSPKGEVTIEYGDHSADTLTPAETIVKKPADNTAGTGTGTGNGGDNSGNTGNTNGGDNGNTGNSGNNAGNGTSTTQPSIKLPAEKVKVVDTTKLTESEKAKVKEALIKANADLKDENIEVADNGNVTITKPDGKVINISADKVVEKEAIIIDLPMDKEFVESIFGKASTDKSDSNKDRVPNTGATSEATTALSASLMLMGALLVLKKRKEENR